MPMLLDSNASIKTEGVKSYYQSKIDTLKIALKNKKINLRRLEAQRNELNPKGLFWCSDHSQI